MEESDRIVEAENGPVCWNNHETDEPGPVEWSFCPIVGISRYPYKHVNRDISEVVADLFFNEGKFWTRHWDLFYVWPPVSISDKAIIFVSTDQVQQLLDEINENIPPLHLTINSLSDKGLVLDFPDHPTLRPRYLGCSNSKEDFEDLQVDMPTKSQQTSLRGQNYGNPDGRSLEAFKQTIEAAMEANKNKNKNTKAKKKEDRIQKQQVMVKQLKRTERYLGLRPKSESMPDPSTNPDLDWDELQAAQAVWNDIQNPPPINADKAAPHPFELMPVFICVDVEAFERDHSIITEIGVATLDTLDLVGVAPGVNGENWHSKIRARHFRIAEYAGLKNTEFVNGCPDRFEFGKSEFVQNALAPNALAECFRLQKSHLPKTTMLNENIKSSSSKGGPTLDSERRNIILVGHDTMQDINYMDKLGYNPLDLPNMLEVLDTASLYRAWKHDVQGRSLANLMYEFDMAGWNLHNAGNDAVYTMWVMLAIAVTNSELRGSKTLQKQREDAQWEKATIAVQETITRVADEREGWSSADEGDDGGVPLKLGRDGILYYSPGNTRDKKKGALDQV